MSFARPDLLPLLFIIPLLLAGAIWLYARRRVRIARAFSDAHLLARLGGDELLRFPLPRLVLLVLAGASAGVAAAGPRWGYETAEGQSLSLNIVVATDISKSMLVPDVEPNRLERSRLFARRMLRELPGDRFGLVVFAGRAYILSPLTSDHSALELYLDALDPEMVSQGGSSLAAAIAQATDLVRGSETGVGDRAVVLLSDGEALEDVGGVEAAADRAARAGVRFITIGVGTPDGDRVPDVDPASGQVVGYKRDEAGQIVISRLDENLLRSVAERTGGRYVRMDDAAALSRVIGQLQGMQRERGDSTQRVEARERFALFAALALILLALDMVLYGTAQPASLTRPGAKPRASSHDDDAAPDAGHGAARRGPRRRTVRAAVLALLFTATAFGIGDLEKGNRLYREGKYEDAVAAYQRVVESGKASPQVHYNLGTALLALGRYDEARVRVERALEMYLHSHGPEHPPAHQRIQRPDLIDHGGWVGQLLRQECHDLGGRRQGVEQRAAAVGLLHLWVTSDLPSRAIGLNESVPKPFPGGSVRTSSGSRGTRPDATGVARPERPTPSISAARR